MSKKAKPSAEVVVKTFLKELSDAEANERREREVGMRERKVDKVVGFLVNSIRRESAEEALKLLDATHEALEKDDASTLIKFASDIMNQWHNPEVDRLEILTLFHKASLIHQVQRRLIEALMNNQ